MLFSAGKQAQPILDKRVAQKVSPTHQKTNPVCDFQQNFCQTVLPVLSKTFVDHLLDSLILSPLTRAVGSVGMSFPRMEIDLGKQITLIY